METIIAKFKVLNTALMRLEQALSYFTQIKESCKKIQPNGEENIVYTVARDSIIQRFKFSVELFWKYIRLYLEDQENVAVDINTPRAVIRTACQARIISEDQAVLCMSMIESRNLTSHIYEEEIAEQLSKDIPRYYELMKKIIDTLPPEGTCKKTMSNGCGQNKY
jgi:nucleotidyltransferase substrate binding protein (TIGR01987 family)